MLQQPIWQVRKEDRSLYPFDNVQDAVMFAAANTTYEHMCTLILPDGKEYTMLQRQTPKK